MQFVLLSWDKPYYVLSWNFPSTTTDNTDGSGWWVCPLECSSGLHPVQKAGNWAWSELHSRSVFFQVWNRLEPDAVIVSWSSEFVLPYHSVLQTVGPTLISIYH